eukprot:10024-Heterococcus_DN1.PRE.4
MLSTTVLPLAVGKTLDTPVDLRLKYKSNNSCTSGCGCDACVVHAVQANDQAANKESTCAAAKCSVMPESMVQQQHHESARDPVA